MSIRFIARALYRNKGETSTFNSLDLILYENTNAFPTRYLEACAMLARIVESSVGEKVLVYLDDLVTTSRKSF